MFPFARVPFWYRLLEPQPYVSLWHAMALKLEEDQVGKLVGAVPAVPRRDPLILPVLVSGTKGPPVERLE